MKVYRRAAAQTVRAASNGPTVGGYAALFNEVTDLGQVYERIEPGAFDGADMSDVRLLYNHEGVPLARSSAGTLAVMIDPKGLKYVAALSDTELARQIADSARRGDITQSSFAFTITRQRWDEHNGRPLRVIESIGKVIDVSPVSYPAYENTEFSLVK